MKAIGVTGCRHWSFAPWEKTVRLSQFLRCKYANWGVSLFQGSATTVWKRKVGELVSSVIIFFFFVELLLFNCLHVCLHPRRYPTNQNLFNPPLGKPLKPNSSKQETNHGGATVKWNIQNKDALKWWFTGEHRCRHFLSSSRTNDNNLKIFSEWACGRTNEDAKIEAYIMLQLLQCVCILLYFYIYISIYI